MHLWTHFAYLDPGTGSLIIQSLIGISAGIALFGRKSISNLGVKARTMFSKPKVDAEEK